MQPLQERTITSDAPARRLLSADEVGRTLGIDVSTVYRMAGDGRLPARKVGRQWRFPADALLGVASGIDPALALAVAGLAAELLGVTVVVTDLTGRPIIPVQNPCQRLTTAGAEAIDSCITEWGALAQSLDLVPRFHRGPLGFECAAAFVRGSDRLLGLVIVGGIAPSDDPAPDVFVLDEIERQHTLAALPRIAAAVAERRNS